MSLNMRKFTNFDYLLFLSVLSLLFIGILFIYSSGVNSEGVLVSGEYKKQIIWACTGIIFFMMATFYDYRKIKDRSILIYLVGIIILIYVKLLGTEKNYSKSWIGIQSLGVGIQPSEFVKIAFILFLAYFLEKSKNEDSLRRFVKAICIMLIPMLLILAQPDLGTASVYIPIFFIMCFVAGIPLKFLLYFFSLGMLAIIFTLMPLWEEFILKKNYMIGSVLKNPQLSLIIFFASGACTLLAMIGNLFFKRKYYYWLAYIFSILTLALVGSILGMKALKPYQMKRLIIFLNPEVDPFDTGWHIIQSITAIGSGGLSGFGFLKGTQSHYRYLPVQSTDFIFSILSEEWGFIGGLVVFALYGILFLRLLFALSRCEDIFGKLVISGIIAMFFFHFMVNVGMVMGIMPITGIPLMFLSYGGSSLWTAMLAVGIVMGINLRQI